MGVLDLTGIAKEIYDCSHRLTNVGDGLYKLSREKAETERAYRKALQIAIMELKDQKCQATLIPDIARGMTADLKFERDLAETRWSSARDNVDAIKSELTGLQTIFKRFDEV